MQHFLVKNELLTRALDARLAAVHRVADGTRQRGLNADTDYSPFYTEVAYFVHLIIEHQEFRSLFIDLLNYADKLKKDKDFQQTVIDINQQVKSIATALESHADFAKLTSQGEDYRNPAATPITLKAAELVEELKKYDLANRHAENDLMHTVGVLERIAMDMEKHADKATLKPIYDLFPALEALYNRHKYFVNFNHGYKGVQAAQELTMIYRSLNPLFTLGPDILGLLQNDNIKKGKQVLAPDTLGTLEADCVQIVAYLRDRLYVQLSIESYVDRFVTYTALYFTKDFKDNDAEGALQEDFQEFLFNAGYYPISEAQVKNGRLDTIGVQQQDAFLFEIKQVDLGKTAEKDVSGRVKNAQIQSSVYLDSLNGYPNLNHHVFIILFTNRKVYFKNNADRIIKNNITFIVKTVVVYETTASKLKDDCEVDINDLIL